MVNRLIKRNRCYKMVKETWKNFNNTKYLVSNFGRVVSMKKHYWRILKPGHDKDGYERVDISDNGNVKHYHVHKLVCLCFIPNPENKPCSNHKNGIKTDNRLENLEWATVSENTQHAFDNGFISALRGSKNHFSKITEVDVLKVRSLLSHNTTRQVSNRLGFSYTIVSDIKARRTWTHV